MEHHRVIFSPYALLTDTGETMAKELHGRWCKLCNLVIYRETPNEASISMWEHFVIKHPSWNRHIENCREMVKTAKDILKEVCEETGYPLY